MQLKPVRCIFGFHKWGNWSSWKSIRDVDDYMVLMRTRECECCGDEQKKVEEIKTLKRMMEVIINEKGNGTRS